ncbi:hypothetical protein ACU8DI_14885 [Psychroserpens sp. BH13MA-6]
MRILLPLIFLSIASCSKPKTDIENFNLKGDVWKIQETTYDASEKFGNYVTEDKEYSGHSYLEFNEQGNLVEYRSLDKRGKTNWNQDFKYNDKNIRTEITTLEDGKVDRKEINSINNDKITKVEVYDGDGEKTNIYNYEYSGHNISNGYVQNDKGKTTLIFKNVWNKGQLVKQEVKDSLGDLDYLDQYERNDFNDVILYTYSNPKDSIKNTYKYDYEYDEKNNWIKKYDFDKNGKIDNIIIRNIVYFDDSKKSRTVDDFIGMWFEVDEKEWIEFRKDKKYDSGYNSRIKESGTWEIDFDAKLITFRAKEPDDSKKYRFGFEGYQMVLFAMDGKEKMRLEKR